MTRNLIEYLNLFMPGTILKKCAVWYYDIFDNNSEIEIVSSQGELFWYWSKFLLQVFKKCSHKKDTSTSGRAFLGFSGINRLTQHACSAQKQPENLSDNYLTKQNSGNYLNEKSSSGHNQ